MYNYLADEQICYDNMTHTIFKSLWYVMYGSSLKYGDLFTFTAKFDMLVVSVIKMM
jgi:hypothetical protein